MVDVPSKFGFAEQTIPLLQAFWLTEMFLFIVLQDGPFAWSEPTQGLVLGAYFWGYILTQIPGGRVAEMFSAKWVIWGSVLVNVVFTILTPVAANISYIAVLVVRFIEGLGAVRSLFLLFFMCFNSSLKNSNNNEFF